MYSVAHISFVRRRGMSGTLHKLGESLPGMFALSLNSEWFSVFPFTFSVNTHFSSY